MNEEGVNKCMKNENLQKLIIILYTEFPLLHRLAYTHVRVCPVAYAWMCSHITGH